MYQSNYTNALFQLRIFKVLIDYHYSVCAGRETVCHFLRGRMLCAIQRRVVLEVGTQYGALHKYLYKIFIKIK